RRILAITDRLRDVWTTASKPHNAAVRPRVARLVQQVAGVFAEVDTVKDLDKPLEQIEKAIHGLYGPDQSANSAFYFGRRGKGHHDKPDTD
ncbi:hypothetical protein LCGC14_2308870, partial [marine sediment metagenome]